MNILPHKSWNVWSEKNIARVERDEAEAKRKDEERKLKDEQVERERRVEQLKKKRRRRDNSDEPQKVERFNLFEKEEREAAKSENPDVVRERNRRERDELEKSRDYLGGRNRDAVPWYAVDALSHKDGHRIRSKEARQESLEAKRKIAEDPMAGYGTAAAAESNRGVKKTRPVHLGEKGGETSIEKLRRERSERETREHDRIRKVLGRDEREKRESVTDERKREYSEGFLKYSGGQTAKTQQQGGREGTPSRFDL
eukprot:CAMPEP_0198735834 /NCGR_PEP_ID=MMETSP1475-20131203/61971_1 /TAXON_ID= ORGANISM="Unidentified sp., Strain CCMP1999" /NCGR_SAMPLE_ID=MMETSP1475 /ASSEMBLY_ACC=CAM_ASM_001111 /LENGTH=254 /DNA_ID=CAMNT_0044499557 /DNA_START=64 /DNA_END=827 /DNA_ORIENTATION=-